MSEMNDSFQDDAEIVFGEDELSQIELLDENGELQQFNIFGSLELDDTRYVVVSPADNDEEIIVLRVSEEDGEVVFDAVVDETELNEVIAALNELIDEQQ